MTLDPSLQQLLPEPLMKTTKQPRKDGEQHLCRLVLVNLFRCHCLLIGERKGPFIPRLITPAMVREWEHNREEAQQKRSKKKGVPSPPVASDPAARARVIAATAAAANAATIIAINQTLPPSLRQSLR